MELNEALGRISEIREKLTGDDRLKRFRCATASLTAVAAFWGGFYQFQYRSTFEGAAYPFVSFWISIAVFCAAVTGAELWWGHRNESVRERRLAWKMASEFSLYLGAGFLLTVAVIWRVPAFVALLPPIWGTLFGLGLFGVRRYFSQKMAWAGALYLMSSFLVLIFFGAGGSLYAMPLIFGIGQMVVATILISDNDNEVNDQG